MPDEIRKIGEGSYWKTATFTGNGSNYVNLTNVVKQPTVCQIGMEEGTFQIVGEEDDWKRYLIYCDNYSGIVFHVDTDDLRGYRSKVSYQPINISYNASAKTCRFELGGVLKFKSGVKYRVLYSEY